MLAVRHHGCGVRVGAVDVQKLTVDSVQPSPFTVLAVRPRCGWLSLTPKSRAAALLYFQDMVLYRMGLMAALR